MYSDPPIDRERVSTLVEQHGTPSYLYDIERIRENVDAVTETFPSFKLFYAVKANPSLSLCSLLRNQGVGAEVASGGELLTVEAAGFDPNNVIFVGPGKSDEELELAVDRGIQAVVVESVNELRRLEETCRRKDIQSDALLRINTDAKVEGAPEQMVGGSSRFGIDEENVVESVGAMELDRVTITGIHAYSASQVLAPEKIIAQVEYISDLASAVATDLGFDLELVDYGGGFGVPYSREDTPLDLQQVREGISDAVKSLRQKHPNVTPAFELGRYLVAEAGVYLTKVLDVKQSRDEHYLVTNGGMNQFIRPAFTSTEHPIMNFSKSEGPTKTTSVVGKLCTPFDILGEDVELSNPERGDVLGVLHTGAYGFSMSMLNFLSHPWPSEILVTPDDSHVIRPRGDVSTPNRHERLIEIGSGDP